MDSIYVIISNEYRMPKPIVFMTLWIITTLTLFSGGILSGPASSTKSESGDKTPGDRRVNRIGIQTRNMITVDQVFRILPWHIMAGPTESSKPRRTRMARNHSEYSRTLSRVVPNLFLMNAQKLMFVSAVGKDIRLLSTVSAHEW